MQIRSFFLHHPLFFGLALTPLTLFLEHYFPSMRAPLFVLSLLAIIPLAALLSHSTEHIAERLGNAPGGLLTATMGNMTELIIGLTALKAGLYDLVKAAIAGAVITNGMFTLGVSFFAGGIRNHIQKLNLEYVHLQAGSLLLATIALLVPSVLQTLPNPDVMQALQPISLALSIVLVVVYLLGLYFTLVTHSEIFNQQKKVEPRKFNGLPLPVYIVSMMIATLLIALISEIFVGTLSTAAEQLHLSQAFIGFILVALAGGAAEMYSAIHASLVNRPELSVAIALGSSTQISLFVAPVLVILSYFIASVPMNLQFSGAAVLMVLLSTLSIVTIMSSRYSTWFTGVMLLAIYTIFALTLYLVRLDG